MTAPHLNNALINRLLFLIKILFVLSTWSAVLYCLLFFIFGKNHGLLYGFSWYAIYAAAFILYFSIPTLIIILIYLKIKKENVWNIIKKEITLLVALLISWAVVWLLNNYL